MSAKTDFEEALTAMQIARTALEKASQLYAFAATLEYSRVHPKREVQFVSAMGDTSLWVEALGTQSYKSHYLIRAYDPDIGIAPDFIKELALAEDNQSITYALAGDINLTCKAGIILSCKSEW